MYEVLQNTGSERMNIQNLIKVAEKTTNKSECHVRVSCLLVDKSGRIIAKGYNHHGKGRKMGKWTVHAEMDALNKVRKPSSNLTAFIYRDKGKIITPCDSCQKLLDAYGITTVWHSTGIGKKPIKQEV